MAKAGEAYGFRLSLFKDGAIVGNPTLAAGDVVVVQDDGTVGNITSLPTALGGDTDIVEVALSAAEMGGSAGDTVTVKFEDQAGDEWEPVIIDIPLTARDVDDLATAAALATAQADLDNPDQYKADVSGVATPADVLAQLGVYDGPTYDELLSFFQLVLRSDAGIVVDLAVLLAEINADEGTGAGSYDPTSGGQEEIGDALGGGAATFPSGAIAHEHTVYEDDDVTPLPGVEVWISTDEAGTNRIWKGTTDTFGVARDVFNHLPQLDAGWYYFWHQLAGWDFDDPDYEEVS